MGITKLGRPIEEGMVQNVTVGPDSKGNINTIYMNIGQWEAPCILLAFNIDTGETEQYSIKSAPGNEESGYREIMGAWGIFSASDGNIYMGTYFGGHILKFDPKEKKLTDLGKGWPTESYIYSFAEDDYGNIYASTYPNGCLIKYNLESGKKELIGPFDSQLKYARSALYYDGKVFCVLGTTGTKIASYEPISGKIFVYDYKKEASADVVLLIRDGKLFGLDLISKEIRLLKNDKFIPVKVPEELLKEDEYYNLDHIENRDVFAKSMCLFSESTFRWYQTFPSKPKKITDNRVLMGVTDREIYIKSDGDKIERYGFHYESKGAIMFMIAQGPGGKLYGSSMLPLRMFSYDRQSKTAKKLGNPSNVNAQIYSMAYDKDLIYMASYPNAVISTYDVSRPWEMGTSENSNPRVVGKIGSHQCRPVSLIMEDDGMVYIASVSDYGRQGGALSRYNPKENEFKVWENIAGKQSLKTLTAIGKTNLIACGTSNESGGGAPSLHQEPYVLIFDVEKEEIIDKLHPCVKHGIDGNNSYEIASLRYLNDKLFGITDNGIFFMFDINIKKYILNVKLPIEGIFNNGMDIYNGRAIYGVGNGQLFKYDFINLEFEKLIRVEEWKRGFVLLDDKIYGTSGTELISYNIQA